MIPDRQRGTAADNIASKTERIYAIRSAAQGVGRDPVCHMQVQPESPFRLEHLGVDYPFCSARCQEKFRHWPQRYVHSQPGRRA